MTVEICQRWRYILLFLHKSFFFPSSIMIHCRRSIFPLHIDMEFDLRLTFNNGIWSKVAVGLFWAQSFIFLTPLVFLPLPPEGWAWVVADPRQRDEWSRPEYILQPEAQPPLPTHRQVSEKKKVFEVVSHWDIRSVFCSLFSQ